MIGSCRESTTENTYSDPANLGTQISLNHEDPFPTNFNLEDPYFQPRAIDANRIQPNYSLIGDDFGPQQTRDIDQPLPWSEPDVFPAANLSSEIPRGSYCEDQLSTEYWKQTQEGNTYNASRFREANSPAGSTNTVALDSTYSVGSLIPFPQQNISYISDSSSHAFGEAPEPALYSSSLTFKKPPQPTLDHTRLLKRRISSDDTGRYAKPLRIYTQSIPESHPSKDMQKRSISETAAPAYPAQQPAPSKPPNATATPAVAHGGNLSRLGQKRAELGDKMGTDYRPRGEISEENGILFALVDNNWSKSV